MHYKGRVGGGIGADGGVGVGGRRDQGAVIGGLGVGSDWERVPSGMSASDTDLRENK